MAGYPVRVRIGVLSGIVFALWSSGLASPSVAHSIRPWAITQDEISRHEARFRLLACGRSGATRRPPPDLVYTLLDKTSHVDIRSDDS